MRYRKIHRLAPLFLILTIGVIATAFTVRPAYASVSLIGSVVVGLCDGACPGGAITNVVQGDRIMLHSFCEAGGGSGLSGATDNFGDAFSNVIANARGQIWTGVAGGSGSLTVTPTFSGCNFSGSPSGTASIDVFRGVIGLANSNFQLGCSGGCSDTLTLTTLVDQSTVYEGFDVYGGNLLSCPSISNLSGQTTTQTLACLNGLAAAYSVGRTVYKGSISLGGNSFIMSTSASASTGHEAVELTSQNAASNTLTACYGNCGSPPITLTNTNSTHGFAFNQSITVFYEFQSNVNGILQNITTSVARTYTNTLAVQLGVYLIPSCPVGNTPFSQGCPGQLQTAINAIANPAKGRISLQNLALNVFNGQWVAVAFTSSFGPVDLNDTNINVPLFVSNGRMPQQISQSSAQGCACKMGLWAYITGNIIIGAPGGGAPLANSCPGFLDCILPNLVGSLCTNQTPACRNSSALVWVVILSIVSDFFALKTQGELMPSAKIPVGELTMIFALIWILVLSGLALLLVWVPLFFFFVFSVAFGKHTGRYL